MSSESVSTERGSEGVEVGLRVLDERQNAFHDALTRYVNGGAGWRIGLGRRLVEEYAALRSVLQAAPHHARLRAVSVERYAGGNVHCLRLGRYLSRWSSAGLLGAYVHGSLGSYEEVPYSDFDALAVLSHEAFRTPNHLARAARVLRGGRAIMFDYDPLQHHGWFVLTEADLARHCEAYFPTALFAHAKSLLPGRGEALTLAVRDSAGELREAFRSLALSVARQLDGGVFPDDLYALKNLLSQFMLLPALYVQVRDGVGVWKADSFEKARGDFAAEVWESMEEASHIRAVWSYRLPRFQRRLMASAKPWRRQVLRRWPVPVPPHVESRLSPELHAGMALLTARMQHLLPSPRTR